MSLRPLSFTLAGAAMVAALSGCSAPGPTPPLEPGVCYHMVKTVKGAYHFNLVAKNQPNLENCAARLEALRIKFIGMGGSHYEIWGVYQGQFLYINRAGVFSSQTVDGPQYPLLVRTGDGRLAVPGAMPQS